MKNIRSRIKLSTLLWLIFAITFISGEFCLPEAMAQVPARFYWKTLSGANAVPLIYENISGNTNPFDPSHNVSAGAEIDATLTMAGYAKVFPLFDRTAMAAVIVPMGNISGEVNFAGNTYKQSSNGFGDPMLEFDINIFGPKAQNSLPDVMRYEPGFSVDLLADLAIPVGDYENDQPLNIGQNRWYGRVGMPIIIQIGSWVPGRRTTLEFLPAAWFFGTNDDYVGQTLETDPMYQLDSHLTCDFTDRFWAAVDGAYYYHGKSTVNGVEGDTLNNYGVGFTFGYFINENLNLTAGYKSTINDGGSKDLRMDNFMVTLVYGWHNILEGSRRLKSE